MKTMEFCSGSMLHGFQGNPWNFPMLFPWFFHGFPMLSIPGQLNFAVFCASSACGVSVEHLNAKEPMIRSIYHFHVYYHIRRILKILEIPLPYENSFNQYNNPYNHEKFIRICSEYGGQ